MRPNHLRTRLSTALLELVRQGVGGPAKTQVVNDLVVFDVPEDGESVTSELVDRLDAEEQ